MLINSITWKIFDYTIDISLCKVGEVMRIIPKKRTPQENYLINEINKTKLAMEAAYSNFENVVDPDLIDSCIYQLNAVQNRYKYLLKEAKASDTSLC